jgi:hypothetical protein
MNIREEIIEFLICNQPYIKRELDGLKRAKERLIEEVEPVFRRDLREQYDVRIKQWIALHCAKSLAVPAEYVIIELEKIEIEDYLNV